MKSAKMSAIVVAVAVAGMASISVACADEAQARSLLKAMSDYLAAQKAISFDYDSNLEIVSTQQQKIGLASSGTLTIERPDKLRATRTGGFANVEMVFDGKTLSSRSRRRPALAKRSDWWLSCLRGRQIGCSFGE
jgi:hypothetical protein